MITKMIKLIVCLTLVCLSTGSKIPQNFKTCNRKQSDFNKCLQEAVQNAIPQLANPVKELNLPSLEPLKTEATKIDIGKEKVTLTQKLSNCELHGLLGMKVIRFEFNFEEKTLRMAGLVPDLQSICNYEIEGKLLFMPIKGEGVSNISLKNFDLVVNFTYAETVKNGKTYIQVTNGTIDGNLVDAHFAISNLFNGDKELGIRMNQLINENWRDIYEETKADYLEAAMYNFSDLVNRVFSKLSLEEVFDNN